MSKTITTLMDIIQSECIKKGLNEFRSKNHLHMFNDDYQFIKKVTVYDDDIHEIVTRMFFGKFEFESEIVDKFFKKMYINRFYEREPQTQTIEVFASRNVSLCLSYETYINEIVLNIMKYIMNEQESNGKTTGNSKDENRALHADLPQNNINMSLQNDILDFASSNDISKHLNESEGTSRNDTKGYNLNNLLMIKDLLNNILTDFDEKTLLQRW